MSISVRIADFFADQVNRKKSKALSPYPDGARTAGSAGRAPIIAQIGGRINRQSGRGAVNSC